MAPMCPAELRSGVSGGILTCRQMVGRVVNSPVGAEPSFSFSVFCCFFFFFFHFGLVLRLSRAFIPDLHLQLQAVLAVVMHRLGCEKAKKNEHI